MSEPIFCPRVAAEEDLRAWMADYEEWLDAVAALTREPEEPDFAPFSIVNAPA